MKHFLATHGQSVLVIAVIGVMSIGAVVELCFVADASRNFPIENPFSRSISKSVRLPRESWSTGHKTIVLALQTTCHFCNESAPFYRRLVEMTRFTEFKIVAFFPEPVEESKTHLAELGIGDIEVRQAPISAFEVSGTPTLILTNEKGEITNYWVGKLTPEKEDEVVDKLNS